MSETAIKDYKDKDFPLIDNFGDFNLSTILPVQYALVPESDPILKQKTEDFDFDNPPIDPILLYRNLGHTMIQNDGLGLAAPQCGFSHRFFVLRAANVIGVFNPIIVDKSEEEITLEEGCLSFPLLFIKVKRPKKIRVRYTLPNREVVTQVYDGMTARCFQHELDHLDGKTFLTVANRFFIDAGKKKRAKLRSGKYTLRDVGYD